jgi:hypothetical protein
VSSGSDDCGQDGARAKRGYKTRCKEAARRKLIFAIELQGTAIINHSFTKICDARPMPWAMVGIRPPPLAVWQRRTDAHHRMRRRSERALVYEQ